MTTANVQDRGQVHAGEDQQTLKIIPHALGLERRSLIEAMRGHLFELASHAKGICVLCCDSAYDKHVSGRREADRYGGPTSIVFQEHMQYRRSV